MEQLDDESFIILGTSPLSTLTNHNGSAGADGPVSAFSSINESQVIDLANIDSVKPNTQPDKEHHGSMTNSSACNAEPNQTTTSQRIPERSTSLQNSDGSTAELSAAPRVLMSEIDKDDELRTDVHSQLPSLCSAQPSLDDIVGLRTDVHSQLPSLCSSEASLDDIVRLQNLLMDYNGLKDDLVVVNATLKQYYQRSQDWEKAMRDHECQIETLRNENLKLKQEKQSNIDAKENAERKLSELHEENVELKEKQKQYIEKIQYLRVSVSVADSIIKQYRQEFIGPQQSSDEFERDRCEMRDQIFLLRLQLKAQALMKEAAVRVGDHPSSSVTTAAAP